MAGLFGRPPPRNALGDRVAAGLFGAPRQQNALLTSADTFKSKPQGTYNALTPKGMMGRGSIKAAKPSLTDKARDKVSDLLAAVGMDRKEAVRLASRAVSALGDLTSLGDLQTGEDAKNAFKRGDRVGGVTLTALAALGAVPGIGDAAAKAIRAYHGSPHDFDKFSLDKIGTGEGAQAYGRGLYFAESEGVARSYRDALGAPTNPVNDTAKYWLDEAGGDTDRAVAAMRDYTQAARLPADEIARLEHALRNRGRMYEVNINADPNSLVDWDAPIARQGEAPKQFLGEQLSRYLGPVYDRQISNFANKPAGELLSHTMGRGLGGPRLTENALSAGVPGIRYLDGGSRRAGDGSRNYVIFDDSLIDILRKY